MCTSLYYLFLLLSLLILCVLYYPYYLILSPLISGYPPPPLDNQYSASSFNFFPNNILQTTKTPKHIYITFLYILLTIPVCSTIFP